MKAATLLHDEESNDILRFCRKATAQLNDAGVSLLHRGCVRQAIETFTDALTVAQRACRIKDSITENDQLAPPTLFTQNDSVDIRKFLEKAYDRLSRPEPSTQSEIELGVISDDENPAGIQSRCLVKEEEPEPLTNMRKENFIIQIDHLEVNLLDEEEDMAIPCSIICYNYGVAYLCLSTLPKSRPFVDQLYTGALKMFQLAFSTLTSMMKETLESHQMNHVLITGFFVVHNLIRLSATLGMAREKAEYLQYLGYIKQSIDEFCDFRRTIPSSRARAA